MNMYSNPHRTPPEASSALPPPARPQRMPWKVSALLAAVLLTACSSTPLPPWPSAPATRTSAPAPLPRVQPGTVVPAPLGQAPQAQAPRQGAIASPLPPPAPLVAQNEGLLAPPYGAAVADRVLGPPEARALAKVVNDYRPILVVDAHEYTVVGRYLQRFNAIQRYDALLQYTTTANYPEFLTKASQEWYHQPMVAALKAQGLTSDWYYTTSTNPDDKRISMGGTQPDTGRNVNGLKNTVSLLIETRGVGIGRMHIQRRVHSQVTAITSALRSTAERAANLEQVRSFVVRDVSAQACRDQVVVEAAATPTQRELDFLDPETGADRSIRVDWNSSLTLRPTKTRARPCGYWLSPGSNAAVERLKMLGLQVMRVAESGSALADIYS